MDINIKELWLKSGLTQRKFAKESGINRYSVCMAASDPTKECIHMPDDKFYKFCSDHPDIMTLPKDFKYYTRLSLLTNKSIYQIPAGDLRKTIPAYTLYGRSIYLYSFKDNFHETFSKMFLPCEDNNGKLELSEKIDILPYDTDNVPKIGEKFITTKWSEVAEKGKEAAFLYDKYSVSNINVNMECRMLNVKQFADSIGTDVYRMREILKQRNCSLMQYAEYWDKVFKPYIVAVSMDEYEKSQNHGK